MKIVVGLLFIAIILLGCERVQDNDQPCEEKAKSLVPKTLTLYWNIHTQNAWQIIPFQWNDGVNATIQGNVSSKRRCFSCTADELGAFFYKGNKVGEKVNNYYSNSTFIYNTSSYEFQVKLVLDQIPETESVYEISDTERYKSQKFKVIDVNFLMCSLKSTFQ